MLQRHVEVRDDLLGVRQRVDELVGDVHRIGVQDAHPFDAVDLIEFAQQLREADFAIEVEAIVRRVLGDDDQLADAVGGELVGLADDFLDRLGHVLAAHAGDGAEGAKAVATLGDLEVGVVARRDPEAGGVFLALHRGGAEEAALFVLLPSLTLRARRTLRARQRTVYDLRDLLAAEHADDLIDSWHDLQQFVLLAFR